MTRYNQGGSRHRDYDHDFRRRDYDRGFGGFGEFGVPLLGGLAGSLLGNALFPGYGYNISIVSIPFVRLSAIWLSTIWILWSLLKMKTR